MSNETPRFLKLTDDDGQHVATRDTLTGLEWAPAGNAEQPHDQAMAACVALDLLGGGWRAPTRQELTSIVDLTRHDPAVDTEAFPFVESTWYWSSDIAAWSPSVAWLVDFGYGYVGNGHRYVDGFALAVRRAGQSLASGSDA